MTGPMYVLAEEADIARAAAILGPSSSASKALAELKRRRAGGEDVHIFAGPNRLLVGPMPAEGAERTP